MSTRIQERAAKQRRLIAWLQLFAHPSDAGIGDTAYRLLSQAQGRSIAPMLARLMSSCNCQEEDAAAELNRRYPRLSNGGDRLPLT